MGVDMVTLSPLDIIGMADQLAMAQKKNEAIFLYEVWLEKNHDSPLSYAIYFNLGILLTEMEDYAAAEVAYNNALLLNASFQEARLNLGGLCERQGRLAEAVSHWQVLLNAEQSDPSDNSSLLIMTLNNLGRVYEILHDDASAEQMFGRSLIMDSNQSAVFNRRIYLRQKLSRWPIVDNFGEWALPGISDSGEVPVFMAISDENDKHLAVLDQWMGTRTALCLEALYNGVSYLHDRLRIGYIFSRDTLYHDNEGIVRLFELHDRQRFEIHAFHWGQERALSWAASALTVCDHHLAIDEMSDEDVARLIRSLEIDILVDMEDSHENSRLNIMSYRSAPVQLAYFGFRHLGRHPYIDYFITDQFAAKYAPYTSNIVYLPRFFQIGKEVDAVANNLSRMDYGLPESAFVFCYFGDNYKITLPVFSAWMSILDKVEASVLWIAVADDSVRANLIASAESHGINPSRLIFSRPVSKVEERDCYHLADLFLDTYPFCAAQETSDALRQGLPVLTVSGETYVSRLTGSMLNTLGLGELITGNIEEYVASAVAIGTDSARHLLIKTYLHSRKIYSELFNTPVAVKSIEQLYERIAAHTLADRDIPSPASALDREPYFTIVVAHFEGSVSRQEAVRCLQSLYYQKYRNFEIIFIHDGPRNMAWELDEFPPPHDISVRFFHTEERANDYGHSLRDIGIKMARGAYIMLTNADNYHYTNMLMDIYLEIRRPYPDVVIDNINRTAPDIIIYGILASGYLSIGNHNNIVDLREFNMDLARRQWMYMSGYPAIYRNIDCMQFVMRRELWQKEGGWYIKECQAADGLIYQELVKKYGVRYVPGPLAEHL